MTVSDHKSTNFESNSQQYCFLSFNFVTVSDHKSTNFESNSQRIFFESTLRKTVSDHKSTNFESNSQHTTYINNPVDNCFRSQKYKF